MVLHFDQSWMNNFKYFWRNRVSLDDENWIFSGTMNDQGEGGWNRWSRIMKESVDWDDFNVEDEL